MSPDHVTPIKPNFKGEAEVGRSTRPEGAPRTDKNFKKLVKQPGERLEKDEEEFATEEVNNDKPSSIFDLSAKVKSKKSSLVKSPYQQMVPDTDIERPDLLAKKSLFDDGGVEMADDDSSNLTEDFWADTDLKPADQSDQLLADNATDNTLVKDIPEKPVKDNLVQGELIREAATASQIKKGRLDTFSLETDATVLASKKDKAKMQAKSRSEFTHENVDLSTVNPNPNVLDRPSAFNLDKAAVLADDDKTARRTISDIVQQIVKEMHSIKTEGRTDTVVTLRYPPILEGATVTVTAFEERKGEFNVAFANLTNEGKRFLDRKIIEDSLTASLAEQGVIVSALTTTTLPETQTNVDAHKFFTREDREQQRQQRQEGNEEEQA